MIYGNAVLQSNGAFFDLIKALHTTQEVSIWIGHWIGRFLVVLIFIAAVVSASNEVALAVGLNVIPENHMLLKIISLFSKPSAWVAATAIIATTVAMGHFRTLDLNLEKAIAENKERIEKERSKSNA